MTDANTADERQKNTSARLRTDSGGLDAAREHREDLEALAETDLPAAAWANRLLNLLDAEDANGGGSA